MSNIGLVMLGIVLLITSLMKDNIWNYDPYINLLAFFVGILSIYVGLGRQKERIRKEGDR